MQGEWSEAQKHFRNLLGRGSRVRAPIVTINTIMAAYMKHGMFDQVSTQLHCTQLQCCSTCCHRDKSPSLAACVEGMLPDSMDQPHHSNCQRLLMHTV